MSLYRYFVQSDTLKGAMTLDELQREYSTLRQQADAVRGYL
jgi:hypothetical protein